MEDCKIVKQFTKFFYPFSYKDQDPKSRLKDVIISSKGNIMPIWEKFEIDGNELREGISDFFSVDAENSARIADCYKLNINCRTTLDLPKRQQDYLNFTHRGSDNSFKVAITDIRIFLFESEVGLAEITCEYQSNSISDYIDCNYFISEFKSVDNYFMFSKRSDASTETEIKLYLKELFQKILNYVGDVQHFDSNGKDFGAKKLLIYSFVLLDKKPSKLNELLFLARKNYKDSYKLPAKEYSIDNNPNIFQSFENSYWATSLNGAVNVSYLVNDKNTDEFLSNNFSSKLIASYYHLYLSVLHQKYSMKVLSAKMGCLDKIVKQYSIMNTQLKAARKYQSQAASLKFRSFFKNPSNIEHVNKYYDLIRFTFDIETIYGSFNDDIKSLVEICNGYVSKIKERDEKIHKLKKEKIEIFISVFGTLVAFATLFSSSWNILEKAFGETLSFLSPQILIVLGTLLLPIVTIVFNIRGRLIEIKRISKSLSDEVKDGLIESSSKKFQKKPKDKN